MINNSSRISYDFIFDAFMKREKGEKERDEGKKCKFSFVGIAKVEKYFSFLKLLFCGL